MPHNKRAEKQHCKNRPETIMPFENCFSFHVIMHTDHAHIIVPSQPHQNRRKRKLRWNEIIAYLQRNVPETSTNTPRKRHIYCWYLMPTYWDTAVLFFTLHFRCIKFKNIWWGRVRFFHVTWGLTTGNDKCVDFSNKAKYFGITPLY